VRWSDVVVGDYNYYFDLSAMLYSLTQLQQWRVDVLVDEAHNLVERGRKMFSAELDESDFLRLKRTVPEALKKSLTRLMRAFKALGAEQQDDYQVYPDAPVKFLQTLQNTCGDIGEYLAEHPTFVDAQLQQCYFDALHFVRVAELFDRHFLFDITRSADGKSQRLCLRNVIPAPLLAPRFALAQSVTLFSATLSPWHFYNDVLGLPDTTAWIDVASPFKAEQLAVTVAKRISTRYPDRERSLAPIADLIAQQFAARPGNYLAFFSSYDYLQKVADLFVRAYPEVPIWQQERRMGEQERDDFLARFTTDGQGVGFAVLGGTFAEGIDLPGARLIGAFVATPGLPQLNPVNEEMRRRMQDIFGDGYNYTYLYPGLQKVVQAAGRVIRTQQDSGVVVLMDDRFARTEVRELLPVWWTVA
jgi:DNA excision repair protein ERCC-2